MVKLKNIYLFYFVCTAVSILARTFCFIYTTEPSTGFLIHRMKGVGIALMLFIVFALICLFLLSMLSKPKVVEEHSSRCVLSVMSAVLGLAMLIDTLFAFLYSNGITWQFALKEAFMLLSAAVFIFYGICKLKKMPFKPLLLCIPVIFSVFQTIELFTSYATLALITEHLFDIMLVCMLMVFLLWFAKMHNNIDGRYKKFVFPLGLCTSSVCAVSFFSRTITMLSGCSDRIHGKNSLSVSMLFFAVFIFLWLLENFKENENN